MNLDMPLPAPGRLDPLTTEGTPVSNENTPSVIFVCWGNICRSPMAEFVAKKIGHDTARTRYDVDRTPRQALERQAAGQAFEPPQHHQATPATDSLSM